MSGKPKFEGERESDFAEIPGSHIIIMQITSDGNRSVSVGWSEIIIESLSIDHLKKILYLAEDSFYRRRPDLRKQ